MNANIFYSFGIEVRYGTERTRASNRGIVEYKICSFLPVFRYFISFFAGDATVGATIVVVSMNIRCSSVLLLLLSLHYFHTSVELIVGVQYSFSVNSKHETSCEHRNVNMYECLEFGYKMMLLESIHEREEMWKLNTRWLHGIATTGTTTMVKTMERAKEVEEKIAENGKIVQRFRSTQNSFWIACVSAVGRSWNRSRDRRHRRRCLGCVNHFCWIVFSASSTHILFGFLSRLLICSSLTGRITLTSHTYIYKYIQHTISTLKRARLRKRAHHIRATVIEKQTFCPIPSNNNGPRQKNTNETIFHCRSQLKASICKQTRNWEYDKRDGIYKYIQANGFICWLFLIDKIDAQQFKSGFWIKSFSFSSNRSRSCLRLPPVACVIACLIWFVRNSHYETKFYVELKHASFFIIFANFSHFYVFPRFFTHPLALLILLLFEQQCAVERLTAH